MYPGTDEFTEPEFGRSALITIDTQRCTLAGQAFEVPGTTEVLPRIAAISEAFRAAGRPIVHVIRLYLPDGSNAERCRRQQLLSGADMVLVGSEGRLPAKGILPRKVEDLDDARLLAGELLEIGPSEWVLYKPRWGAFFETSLERHLREHAVSTLVICGCNFPNCPRTTLYEGSERDFRLVAIRDGISRFGDDGAAELEAIGVLVIDAATCIAAVRSAPKAAAF